MKKFAKLLVVLFAGILFFNAATFAADINKIMSFQGRLTDSTGYPISGTAQSFVFTVYDAPSLGNTILTVPQTLDVVGGIYTTTLDFSSVSTANADKALYIEVRYNGSTIGTRTPITVSPYALTVVNGAITSSKIASNSMSNPFPIVVSTAAYSSTSTYALNAPSVSSPTFQTLTVTGVSTLNDNVTIASGKSLNISGVGLSFGSFNTSYTGLVVGSSMKVEGIISSTDGILQTNADLAEIYPSDDMLEPGDVVVISTSKDGYIEKSKKANDNRVAGVISTEPGIVLNAAEKGYKLALVGKVPVKITNEGGQIKRGDILVASSKPGYAMKAKDPKPGTIIGKALEDASSNNTIMALVNLQ